MLPRAARLHRSSDFTEVVRRGRRASCATVTVHLVPGGAADVASPARAGLVVGRAVGGSVVRSTVSRRLRHLLPERLAVLPGGSRLVVRASPAAGSAASPQLAADLDEALRRVRRPGGRRPDAPR